MKQRTFTYGRYQIDEVLVLNLENRPDRKWAALGALELAYTPLDRIRIWNAVPASDFETVEQIGEAAVADGFPWFMEYIQIRNLAKSKYPMVVAQAWSYCQMLRHLADNDLSGVILYDDRYILDFEQLSAIYYWLVNQSKDARNPIPFLMLQCEYYANIDHNTQYEWKLHPKFPFLAEGPLGCSENAILYSVEGAKWTLDFLQENLTGTEKKVGANIETALASLSYRPLAERYGVWSAYNCQFVYHATQLGSDREGTSSEIPNIIKQGGWKR